jgi:hypothetical protein
LEWLNKATDVKASALENEVVPFQDTVKSKKLNVLGKT